MQANSRPVTSTQTGVHERLADLVKRHLNQPERKPVSTFNQQAFDQLCARREDRPLVFDAFCGTGHSSATLAQRYPEHLVVGIDQSAHRLTRHPDTLPDNCLLLRAECEAIWQLAAKARWQVDHHYLLYPNPWPKPGHIKRRIHGCGAFPWLLALGGTLELRSNWRLYVEEFAAALDLANISGTISQIYPDTGLTRFEEKYRLSEHALWRYRTD